MPVSVFKIGLLGVSLGRVYNTARAVGLNLDIQPTPAIALGAYEVMPIEIAGAYTVFPNRGILKKPGYIDSIRDQQGRTVYQNQPQDKPAIDPRVAYVMVNMMEEVLRTGTAAGVRGRLRERAWGAILMASYVRGWGGA
jgi:membrane peptidoglycan carboxypeptidase